MSDIAIRVENLSKAYRIGLKEQRHETLMRAMASFVRSPFENYRNLRKLSHFDDASSNSRLSTLNSQPSDIIWALRNMSFEVKHGEVTGIIGSNGAGKSTLLKILSRITEPTSGRAVIHGRVGSLLEVGTGFHPDLTGRENIYLNGTILGMKKREIDAQFDEIVAFSEVEKFIDTPVKRYSSGMRVRLAFAVAAHLNPEILVIDEVLAVGDLNFQKKCLGKMNEVASQGRTVLFVSHNLSFVKDLCQTGLLLSAGQLAYRGAVLDAIAHYTELLQEPAETPTRGGQGGWQNLRLVNQGGVNSNHFDNSEPITLEANLHLSDEIDSAQLICFIDGSDGLSMVYDYLDVSRGSPLLSQAGSYSVRFMVPPLWVAPDAYSVHLKLLATTMGGRQIRSVSPRLLLDITDRHHVMKKRTKAKLRPITTWAINRIW